MKPAHVDCLEPDENIITGEGREVSHLRLHVLDDSGLMSSWAKYFREHYCLDEELDALRDGTGLSREEYLLQLVFPDRSDPPGPSIRAGDFAEILVSDYLEYVRGFWVPRQKYAEKAVRNESVKGVDILGFHLVEPDPTNGNPQDVLIAFEVKAKLSGREYDDTLQDAIDHSKKDYYRRALTLNATKRRLRVLGNIQESLVVQRFQNPSDHPYSYQSGAAAVLNETVFDIEGIAQSTNTSGHPNEEKLELLVIRGNELMSLVHALYARAADEA